MADHPAGRAVTVHYDPADPATAVLQPGLAGEHVFLVLFSVPFNAVLLVLWAAGGIGLWNRLTGRRPITAVRVRDRGDEVRIRLADRSPALAAFLVAFAGSVAAVFLVALCTLGRPPVAVAAGALLLVVAGVAAAYLVSARRSWSDRADFVIDRRRHAITLPATWGRPEPVIRPLDDLVAVHVTEAEEPDGEGGRKTTYTTTARWRTADEPADTPLMPFNDRADAEALAALIRAKVGLPAAG